MQSSFMSFSFGCRVNEAEKQLIDQQLCAAGFSWDTKSPAFYIINSCAITGKAEREMRQHIYQIRKKYPKTIIIATGCSATLWTKTQSQPIGVDYWIDNTKKKTIPTFILSLTGKGVNTQQKNAPDKFIDSGRIMIKIQEGCNRFCSYCIVPYLRGPVTSEPIFNIITRINAVQQPISELILTAINTEGFGKDTGENLTQLVEAILKNTKVERVSFGSIHPWSITQKFLSWYTTQKNNTRIIQFFHIPIQSGSDTILRLMNRQYVQKELRDRLITLHTINSHALLATDVIVGFPGEGEKEFEETYQFLKESPIVRFHIFRYSVRPGTAAEKLISIYPEPSAKEKIQRAKKLAVLGKKKYQDFLKTHIGHTYPALFLQKRTHSYEEALLDNQIPIRVKTKTSYTGMIHSITVTQEKNGVLFGTLAI